MAGKYVLSAALITIVAILGVMLMSRLKVKEEIKENSEKVPKKQTKTK